MANQVAKLSKAVELAQCPALSKTSVSGVFNRHLATLKYILTSLIGSKVLKKKTQTDSITSLLGQPVYYTCMLLFRLFDKLIG